MNKARRKQIDEIRKQVDTLLYLVMNLQSEEEEYRDNIPEAMEERIAKADNVIYFLESAGDALEDASECLDSATE